MLTSGATMSSYWSDDCIDDDMNSSNKNEKRPRTVLSSSQRRVLKTAFDLDPKPSKKVSVLAGKPYHDNQTIAKSVKHTQTTWRISITNVHSALLLLCIIISLFAIVGATCNGC